jgi:hypothetical protein
MVAATVDPDATVENLEAPYATENQLLDDGSVLEVHVTPSGDVAAIFEP